MFKNGTTAIIEWDGTAWNETSGSIKHRIREAIGFDKADIQLMETSATGGVTENVSFTVRGLGWFLDFTSGTVERAAHLDETEQDDGGNIVAAYRQCGGGDND